MDTVIEEAIRLDLQRSVTSPSAGEAFDGPAPPRSVTCTAPVLHYRADISSVPLISSSCLIGLV
ncbi:hypothetical protein FRB95_009292 [Tulasnella sp. JGI-2019a]|nr:hypothetical protein FRB93_012121 [Tulasnella sp. JGI-2019a]KAG9036370.1 hypothetical protein FRB95_009292 [Tulasnella sp. JGI-2019a]